MNRSDRLLASAASMQDRLVSWRRHLHQNPELSFEELETSVFIAEQLRGAGLEPRIVAHTGVMVDIDGEGEGKRVAVRADIDALPIVEETGLPFASRRHGVMHACGHDGHTAIALGLARHLAGRRDFDGSIRIFFQPAEEKPPGGAVMMIEGGALDGCDSAIGLHLIADIPVRHAGIRVGPMMANADNFEVRIIGEGGHASQPHKSADSIAVAAHAIVNLQSIISRRVDPMQPAVITVGKIEGGFTHNVIAPETKLIGTIRSFDEETRKLMHHEIEHVLEETASMYGCRCEVEILGGYPAVVNEPRITAVLEDAVRSIMGNEALVEQRPIMGGEDFSYYAQKVPAAFLFLGAGSAASGATAPHHHPKFTIDEQALPLGVAVLAAAAIQLASSTD